MLSHDTRLRCDLVDLYYKLYGNKKPTCLPIPELAGLLKPQKVNESKKRSHNYESASSSQLNNKNGNKERSNVIIEESFECVNVEVVANTTTTKIKVNYKKQANINILFDYIFRMKTW